MNSLIKKLDSLIEKLASSRVFKSDFDYHLVRGSMVFVFLMLGYQKSLEYEAQTLIPFIKNGRLLVCRGSPQAGGVFAATVSFPIAPPGVWAPGLGGLPALSALPGAVPHQGPRLVWHFALVAR